jgi:hypothetical protein
MLDDQPRTYVDNGVLEVQPPSPQLGRNGKCTFRVRVRDVSMNFDNRDFVLQVSAVTRASKYYVAPIVSDPMTVGAFAPTHAHAAASRCCCETAEP